MKTNKKLLTMLCAAALTVSATPLGVLPAVTPLDSRVNAVDTEEQDANLGLKDALKDDFKFGMHIDSYTSNPELWLENFLQHCNLGCTDRLFLDYYDLAECEDKLNPPVTIPDKYDQMLKMLEENGIPFYLGWLFPDNTDFFWKENYEHNSPYVTKEVANQRLENYIRNIFTKLAEDYPNLKIEGCTVIGEVFTDKGELKYETMKKIYGDAEFAENAFVYARKYAPESCKLYIEDYNCISKDFRTVMFAFTKDLVEKELLDGIDLGILADFYLENGQDSWGKPLYDEVMTYYHSLGLEIRFDNLAFGGFSGYPGDIAYLQLIEGLQQRSDMISSIVFGPFIAGFDVPIEPDYDWLWTELYDENGSEDDGAGGENVTKYGLKDVYSSYFKIGKAVRSNHFADDSDTGILPEVHHFNSLTYDIEHDTSALIDQSACQESGDEINVIVDIGRMDSVLVYAQTSGTPLTIENLISSSLPGWFFKEGFSNENKLVTKEVLEKRFESYIQNLFAAISTEYPGVKIENAVVSETYYNVYDSSYWKSFYQTEEPELLVKLFTLARQYAPEGCKLYLYDLSSMMGEEKDVTLQMAEILKEKELLDGISIACYLKAATGSDPVDMFDKFGAAYIDTGLDLRFANVCVSGVWGVQAQNLYADFFKVLLPYAEHISAITFLEDSTSWDGPETNIDYEMMMQIPGGDANSDGYVDISDAILMSRYAASDTGISVTPQALRNSDLNGDGKYTAEDVVVILKKIAHLI